MEIRVRGCKLEVLGGRTLAPSMRLSTSHLVSASCYVRGMTRARVSTTVSADLLRAARELAAWRSDAAMMDAALDALISRHHKAEIDAAYAEAYEAQPLSAPDAWGDLASFRDAAAAS